MWCYLLYQRRAMKRQRTATASSVRGRDWSAVMMLCSEASLPPTALGAISGEQPVNSLPLGSQQTKYFLPGPALVAKCQPTSVFPIQF